MTHTFMTSLERVLTTLGHKEPDRVPLFLLVTLHGARELGVSIQQYFSRPDLVAEGQLRMRKKFGHDCLYSFFYAAVEIEAWGGEVIHVDDGPPNSGMPFIRKMDQIDSLEPPSVKNSPCLYKILEATRAMKDAVGTDAPIIGVVMSPFSLPVMQMGFGPYLDLMHEHPDRFNRLMAVNTAFCVEWANAQLAAGATAICYFDPVSSTTIIPADLYRKTGKIIATKTISRIQGPVATHMASGACLEILADIHETGTAVVGVSADENLRDMKLACAGKLTVLGNLNGLEMIDWTEEDAISAVRKAIGHTGPGGGFILSDNHGEIPWQVSENVLMAVSHAVHEYGQYPIRQMEID